MKRFTLIISLIVLSISPFLLFGQTIIYLENTSFEGKIGIKTLPKGWENGNADNELPSDIQSLDFRHPQLNNEEIPLPEVLEGKSYLALYTDYSGKNGAIAQKLSQPLEAGYCYLYSVYACYFLCKKPTPNQKRSLYYSPARLRIWGSNAPNERGELLAESRAVRYSLWSKKTFLIEPLENWTHFIIEATYDESIDPEPYDGKILLDNGSPIGQVDCETIDYDFLDNASYAFDPVEEYDDYMNSFLKRNWERTLFKEKEATLTKDAENVLQEILTVTNQTRYERKLYFIFDGKNAELDKARLAHLRAKLKEWGLKNRYFYAGILAASDLKRKWIARNPQMWVRYEYY